MVVLHLDPELLGYHDCPIARRQRKLAVKAHGKLLPSAHLMGKAQRGEDPVLRGPLPGGENLRLLLTF